MKRRCGLQALLRAFLAAAALSFHGAEAVGEGTASRLPPHATSPPAVAVGREDLLRVRASLQRISDEMHLILNVLDQALEAPPMTFQPPAWSGGAGEGSGGAAGGPRHEDPVAVPQATDEDASEGQPSTLGAAGGVVGPWAWAIGGWLAWAGIWMLDIGIVVGMQLFLESIGRKRGGSSIMPKRNVANAIASKAAPASGAPIPAPSATPGRASSQRLSVLSQEELLAAALTEHWGKLVVGAGMAVAFRLPQQVLSNDSLICHMLSNFTVMLRCMSLVMLLVRDDMTLPKKEKLDKGPAPPPPPPPPRR